MPLRKSLPLALLATCYLLLATPLHAADWSLTTADFQSQTGLTINTWNPADGLSVTDSSGKLTTLDTRSIVTLSSTHIATATSDSTAWRLALRNGDLLLGDPIGVSGQSLQFRTTDLGAILIPIKNIASLTAAIPKNLPNSPPTNLDKDIVYFQNGDTLSGFVLALDADKVQISTSDTGNPTDLRMNLVSRVAFSGLAIPRSVPPLSARITFFSGTILTVPLAGETAKNFSWQLSDITLPDPAGQPHKVSADRIQTVEILGGKVVYLSELDPTTDQQTSFMGTQWPTRINQNVLQQPLKVAGIVYARGLGVHTKSTLTYTLDGTFTTLKLRAALDDSAQPRGMADLSILGDGKILWQAQSLKPGDLSPELNLPLTGIKTLELDANPAAADTTAGKAGIDVLGRVDWLTPALIRQ